VGVFVGIKEIMWAIVWFIAKLIIVAAISAGIGILLQKKPSGPKAPGKEAFQLPTAEEGRPLPLVSGKRRVKSPNAISSLLEYRAKEWDDRGVFRYNIGLHMGWCLAADGFKQFWMAETCLWPTLNDPTSEAADGQTSAYVAARACWGGYGREGGVNGWMDIQYGNDDQTLNVYLAAKLGSSQPAYRGFVGTIMRDFYIGTWAGLKPPSAMIKRTNIHPDRTVMWYLTKANVNDDDLNAVHFLYERLFLRVTGLGKDSSLAGTSWIAAADTCYNEGYGVSNVWDWSPDDIEGMIEQIEQIIDGKIYIDPATGKFEIGLIRDDYDPDSLETFDESDFWVETMDCLSAGKIPSKVIVKWHDKITLQDRPAFADDIALLSRQGGNPIVQILDYAAFVCDGDLANKIASRAQQACSAMPKHYTLRSLRTMADLHETSVFRISYPAMNITSMIVRVLSIDRGSLAAGGCTIEVIEDVFGVSYTVYGTPPDAGAAKAAEELSKQIADLDGYSDIVFETGATVIGGEDGFPIAGEDGALITEG
jgi:hypothetical protein